MTVRLLFFAHLQDIAGGREQTLTLPDGATVRTAADALAAHHAGLSGLLSYVRVAVNAEFSDPDAPLRDGDEVAWMPPVSGGQDV